MRRAIGLLAVVTLALATALPAEAGGRHYGHRHQHGYHHRHDGHGAAIAFGALAGGVLLGALLTRPAYPEPYPVYQRVAPAPPPADPRSCQPTTGTGYVDGRLAEFGGTWCRDAYGSGYIVPGSQYFIRYLQ